MKSLVRLSAVIICVCITSLKTFAATPIYVDAVTGNDSYDGQSAVFDGVHGPVATIQAGILAVEVGGTVEVAAGTYPGSIAVNKSIRLNASSYSSARPGAAVIQGTGSGIGFVIQAPDVTVEGFQITGFEAAISSCGDASDLGNLTIITNNIYGNISAGIRLQNNAFSSIYIGNNTISQTTAGNGLEIIDGVSLNIFEMRTVTISDNRDYGFYVNNGTAANLEYTRFEGCNFRNSANYSGLCIDQAKMGYFEVNGGYATGNKLWGIQIGQNSSVFDNILLSAINLFDNQSGGMNLGGNSTTLGLTIQCCVFKGNGGEHVRLSGGIDEAFNVTNDLMVRANVFSSGAWCAFYVGESGSLYFPPGNFYGNFFMADGWGVYNANTAIIDAKTNYWNSIYGPSDPAGTTEVNIGDSDPGPAASMNVQPEGLVGCKVSDKNVIYFPWQDDPLYHPIYHDQDFPASGGTGKINLFVMSGMPWSNVVDCPWTAVSNDSWITITSGFSGNHDGVISFNVAPNPVGANRSGSITVANEVFVIYQEGAPVIIQPKFVADQTSGWPGFMVQFNDLTPGDIDEWSWDFGDGQTSTLKNPQITYAKPGVYTVTLSMVENGITYSVMREKLITVYGNSPLSKATLELLPGSNDSDREDWGNAIDNCIIGKDGTTSIKGDSAFVILKFKDDREKILNSVSLLTDTDIGHEERWVKDFRLFVSTTGTSEGDFSQVLTASKSEGGWENFQFPPVSARYLKLIIDNPDQGWRQLGEFEANTVRTFADPMLSAVAISSPHVANGLDQSILTISVKSSDGVPISRLSFDDIKIIDWSNSLRIKPVSETDITGVYTTAITSVAAGQKKIDVYVNGVLVGTLQVDFSAPEVRKQVLELVAASNSHNGEGWDNAIDDDVEGWDGTVTANGNPAWAIFCFSDGKIKSLQRLALLVDTGVSYEKRWVTKFRVMVSATGIDDSDFTTVCKGKKKSGDWEYYNFPAVTARYIKFVVENPANEWCQIGELELFASDVMIAPSINGTQQNEMISIARVDDFTVRNFPNPFNPETMVELVLANDDNVIVEVYNLLGQRVKSLYDGFWKNGLHQVHWEGRDSSGQYAPSGVYLLRVQIGTRTRVHRMIMMK